MPSHACTLDHGLQSLPAGSEKKGGLQAMPLTWAYRPPSSLQQNPSIPLRPDSLEPSALQTPRLGAQG